MSQIIALRPNQREAIDVMRASWADGMQRPAVVLPTGAGNEGYAGMCACGFRTPQPSYEHMGDLTRLIWEHLERDVFPPVDEALLLKEAQLIKLGDLIGYHRLVEASEEHGIRHVGWLVAGTRGSMRLKGGAGFGAFQGSWIKFSTEKQEG
ncbi:hypothetical protein ACWEFD_33705 [Streptomyces ardesiacus]